MLNPAIDDGEKYFDYEWDDEIFTVKIKPKTDIGRAKKDRAEKTIDILGLNRGAHPRESGNDKDHLLAERGNILKAVSVLCRLIIKNKINGGNDLNLLKEDLEELKDMASPKSEFSGFVRFFLKLKHPDLYEKHVESG